MRASLTVGAVVRRVFEIYVEQASVLMPAAAVVFVIAGIFTELLYATGSSALAFLGLVVAMIATTLFTGLVAALVLDLEDGRRDASAMQLLRSVLPVLGSLIGVALISGILEGLGFVALVVPGLILVTIWSVAAPVVVIERVTAVTALRRSRELVRGHGWQVFAVILVLLIGVIVVSLALEAVAAEVDAAVGLVVRVVIGVLAAPISALAAAVLYVELRTRREAQREPIL